MSNRHITKAQIKKAALVWVIFVGLAANTGGALAFFVGFSDPYHPGLFEAVILFPITFGWTVAGGLLAFFLAIKLELVEW